MKLYEKFFSIYPKYAYQIADFIKKYCPVMMYKLPYIVAGKCVPNDKDPNLEQNKIIKKLSLKDINEIRLPECNSCNLCDKKIFKEKRASLKSIKHKLLADSLLEQEKVNLIDYLNNELKGLGSQIDKGFHGKLTLRKADNLYHLILIDFIENLISEVNNKVSQNKENILYFEQISRTLLVTEIFLKDIEEIRNRYFQEIKLDSYIKYEVTKQTKENKTELNNYLEDIKKLMTNYNLTPRWTFYIVNGMLRFPSDTEGRLIIPKGETEIPLPDGSPYISKIFQGEKVWCRITLVGDEDQKDIDRLKEKNNIKDVVEAKNRFRKKLINNFKTYLRWYRSKQHYQKHNKQYGIKDEHNYIENIYIQIFLDDMDDNDYRKDWPKDYKYMEDQDSVRKKAEIRIRNGIKKIEDIGFNKIK